MQPPHVARLLWACASAGVDIPDLTLATLVAGLVPALPRLSSSDTTAAAWAVALLQLGQAPAPPQLQRRQQQASPHDVTQAKLSDPPELQPDEQEQQQIRKLSHCPDPHIQHSLLDQSHHPHSPDLVSASSSSSSTATSFLLTEAESDTARYHAKSHIVSVSAVPTHGLKAVVTDRSADEWGWHRQRQQSVQLFVRALLQRTPRLLEEGSPETSLAAAGLWCNLQAVAGRDPGREADPDGGVSRTSRCLNEPKVCGTHSGSQYSSTAQVWECHAEQLVVIVLHLKRASSAFKSCVV